MFLEVASEVSQKLGKESVQDLSLDDVLKSSGSSSYANSFSSIVAYASNSSGHSRRLFLSQTTCLAKFCCSRENAFNASFP